MPAKTKTNSKTQQPVTAEQIRIAKLILHEWGKSTRGVSVGRARAISAARETLKQARKEGKHV